MLTRIFQPLLLVLVAVAAAPTSSSLLTVISDTQINNDGIIGLAYDIVPACDDCGVVADGDGTAIALDIMPACDDCGVVADSDGTAITVAPAEWCCNMLYIGAEKTTEKAAKGPVVVISWDGSGVKGHKSDRENIGMSPPWKGIALQFQNNRGSLYVRIQSRYGQTPHSKNKLGTRSSDLTDT
ncbi:hypothetical protein B0H13DRAFT_1866682 [Mycena leptocephala]|nr:hypothetical protein B0H13DRAFT_1866682 [Mycena leptocephala]